MSPTRTTPAPAPFPRSRWRLSAFPLALLLLAAALVFLLPAGPSSAASVNWQLLPGRATDIGVGGSGVAWKIGTNSVPGGYGIYRFDNGTWVQVPGGAVRIDVGPNGQPWIVNSYGEVFMRDGN